MESIDNMLIIGCIASLTFFSVICIGLCHKKFLISLWKLEQVNVYGIYSSLFEITKHFWFLFRALFVGQRRRNILTGQIKRKFLQLLNKDDDNNNVVITHSCRTIFYCIIKTLLEQQQNNGMRKLRICCASIQFGSFYRLLRGTELAENCEIDFYEIDLNLDDFTLKQEDIDEDKVKECDLILCQHLFGVPFEQDLLFELGKKYDIPILEDCVQSGSLYGKYKGHKLADVAIWSGGLDKTPSCFGGGFGYFYNTKHGKLLYEQVNSMIDGFQVDTFKDRFNGLFNQTLHLILAKNYFYFDYLIACYFYFKYYYNADQVKWFEVSLKIRKNKAITPFQHQSSLFCSKPSMAQLYSIRYGLNKTNYAKAISDEIKKRELMLDNIPKRYHCILFPWLTDKNLDQMKSNQGISEFTWVYSKDGDRMDLNEFLCERGLITIINTTWVHDKKSSLKPNNSQFICDNITYLPNLAQMNKRQIILCAQMLTDYCKYKNY